MSGTGKSTLIAMLASRGYRAVDLDTDEWSEWVAVAGDDPYATSADTGTMWQGQDWVWREDRVERLLSRDGDGMLFVSGTAANQGKFHPRFDYIIVLTAPVGVLKERLATRATNGYGKNPGELARVLQHVETVEPLLRRAATLVLDTDAPLDRVLERVLEAVRK
jgi:broad-specificity NMP kinase